MPKKFAGENSKAAEAKARKAAVQHERAEKKQKEEEDKYWQDDDKLVNRKLERKEDKDKKQLEKLERKQEAQRLLEQELATLKSAKPVKEAKVTRHEIEKHKEKQEEKPTKQSSECVTPAEPDLEVNPNRVELEHEHATGIDEALKVLSLDKDKALDKNPEKRMKAAYLQFEEENMPRLKQENPNLRLSQLKQLLQKDWQKSPSNPLIQNIKE